MGFFISEYNLVRNYPIKNQIEIVNTGYNDFHTVKPLKQFWIDNTATFHFVISGKGYLFFNEKKYKLKKGDLFLLPSGEKRMYYPDQDDPWEYIWFGIQGDNYESISQALNLSKENPVKINADFEQLIEVYGELAQKLQNGNDDGYFALSCLYKIIHILKTGNYSGVQGAKLIIDENFSQKDFTVDNLCRTVGMSHSELCRRFRQTFGITPIEYLTDKRIKYSEALLKETTLSVSAVAYSCGYSDALHFMKKFKKIHNCTCLEYRHKEQ